MNYSWNIIAFLSWCSAET